MIDVKSAVNLAFSAVKEFYDGQDVSDLLLEEIEKSGDDKYWLITIGFNVPAKITPNPIVIFAGGARSYERKYKILKINSETSKVESMKIRNNE